jgi:hypothetical protein
VVGQDRVTVVVGTFGSESWARLARDRAIPSAEMQAPVVHVHGGTLARARNEALGQVKTEFVVTLDADDELAPDYVAQMLEGWADIRAPAVRHVWPSWQSEPEVPRVWGHEHDCEAGCLRHGNFCCIGSMVRTELARKVGWEEFGWSEDWYTYARCVRAGATIESLPNAVYIAHHRPRSRNRVANAVGLKWHRAIERAVWPEDYDSALMEIRERFDSKAERVPGGCWEWRGARNNDGYGSLWNGERYPGKNGKRGGPVMILAHRWAFEHFLRPIPEGMCVLHRCDNPGCVNPQHLWLGTQADNIRDCQRKGRRNQSRYVKLSAEAHEEIRDRYTAGGVTQKELAAEFGVSGAAIRHVVRGSPNRWHTARS